MICASVAATFIASASPSASRAPPPAPIAPSDPSQHRRSSASAARKRKCAMSDLPLDPTGESREWDGMGWLGLQSRPIRRPRIRQPKPTAWALDKVARAAA